MCLKITPHIQTTVAACALTMSVHCDQNYTGKKDEINNICKHHVTQVYNIKLNGRVIP